VSSFFDDWDTEELSSDDEIGMEFVGAAWTTDDICDDNSDGTVEVVSVEDNEVHGKETSDPDNDVADHLETKRSCQLRTTKFMVKKPVTRTMMLLITWRRRKTAC
jgi:hypothetical protein